VRSSGRPIAINADVGEGFPDDEDLMPLLDRASVACGGHAGSQRTMTRAVRLAARYGVAVGAHVSYPDRRGFGRVTIPMPGIAAAVTAQARALARVARRARLPLDHVKLHGALYHDASTDPRIAIAVGRAIRRLGGGVGWIGMPGTWQERTARRFGIPFIREGFADRRYRRCRRHRWGRLVPRGEPGALVRGPAAAARQARRLAAGGQVDTLCVHSDTPGCVRIARAVRAAVSR